MTGQNRSSAVMQQRKSPPAALDYFPTPPWATRALCEWLLRRGYVLTDMCCDEPACGEGYMARPLAEYFGEVYASDIHDYGRGYPVTDFIDQPLLDQDRALRRRPHWIITNPPFNRSADFALQAMGLATVGIAMFVRIAWLEGEERYDHIFSLSTLRPTLWLQYVERVVLLKGRLVRPNAIDPRTGKRVSSATAYGWAVWLLKDKDDGTRTVRLAQDGLSALDWIAPCRTRLERPGDYPLYPEGAFV